MLTRVKLGQESLVAQVAAINRVLGDQSILDKMGCNQSSFTEVKKVCNEAKNCDALNMTLEKLEKQTQDALSQIEIIEKEIQTREINIRHPRTSVQNRTKYKTELNWLQIQLQTQKSLIPWAEGDVFKKTIKSKRPVGEAIQKQLEEDRRVLVRTFADSEKMKRCITGNPQRNDRCSTADIVEMAKYTPPVPSVYNFSKDKDQQRMLLTHF